MTESEWLDSEDPAAMLQWLDAPHPGGVSGTDSTGAKYAHHITDRKLRLFACAVSVQHGQHEKRKRSIMVEHRDMIARAERWADTGNRGLAKEHDHAWFAMDSDASAAAKGVVHYLSFSVKGAVTNLLRDIVGNPFRPVVVLESWLTMDVRSVGQAAYEEQQADGTLDPFRLLLLADALEEAGCTDAKCPMCCGSGEAMNLLDRREGKAKKLIEWLNCPLCAGSKTYGLLSHLRSSGPHVRGCWALDLLLGKE